MAYLIWQVAQALIFAAFAATGGCPVLRAFCEGQTANGCVIRFVRTGQEER